MESPIILMPAHNEESQLPGVLEQWAEHAGQIPLLIVLDRCKDKSQDIVESYSRWNPSVTFLATSNNVHGKAGAILQGLWSLLRSDTHAETPIILWDSDGEYDFSALVPLLQVFLDSLAQPNTSSAPLMAVGIRQGQWLARSVIANRLSRAVLAYRTGKIPPTDMLSGSRILFLRDMLLALQSATGFTVEMHINRHMLERSARIVESPVLYTPRTKGKNITAWDLPKILWAGLS